MSAGNDGVPFGASFALAGEREKKHLLLRWLPSKNVREDFQRRFAAEEASEATTEGPGSNWKADDRDQQSRDQKEALPKNNQSQNQIRTHHLDEVRPLG